VGEEVGQGETLATSEVGHVRDRRHNVTGVNDGVQFGKMYR
jgi:hypothetical protein